MHVGIPRGRENENGVSSYAVAYLRPECSAMALMRPGISDWRSKVDEQLIKVQHKNIKVEHALQNVIISYDIILIQKFQIFQLIYR